MNAAEETQRFDAEELADLAYWLREHGVAVDARQLVAAARLLHEMEGQPPLSELGIWLSPIFSTCASEQDAFPGLYLAWLRLRHPEAVRNTERPDWRPEPEVPGDQPRFRRYGRLLITAALSTLLALAGTGIWLLWRCETEVRVSMNGQPVSAAVQSSNPAVTVTREPSGNAVVTYRRMDLAFKLTVTHMDGGCDTQPVVVTIDVKRVQSFIDVDLRKECRVPPHEAARQPVTELGQRIVVIPAPTRERVADVRQRPVHLLNMGMVLACTLLALAVLVWWAFATFRWRGFLQRLPSDGDEFAKRISSTSSTALLAYRGGLRYLSREMRRRLWAPSRALDVTATIAATMRNGGITQLVFGTRAEPDYLVLVDRIHPSDHLAHLADDVITSLLGLGVSLERYEFERDPRFAYHAPLENRARRSVASNVETLAGRHAGARIIIFSDGEGLISPYTGKPLPWLRELADWPSSVMMTPVPRALWSGREQAIAAAGLAILPFDADGLHLLGSIYRQERALPAIDDAPEGMPKPAYLRDEDLLLESYGMPKAAVEELLRDLELDLEEGFAWLAGCAVYPEIHWGVTLAVGDCLLDHRSNSVAARGKADYVMLLTRLSRLPWLRHGYMPDWLRAQLLQRLGPAEEARIRRHLASLFDAIAAQAGRPPGKQALQVVARPHGPWRDALAGLKGAWKRRSVSRIGPDRIFLRFMSGPHPRLAVAATEKFMRLFYHGGSALGGPRALPLCVAAVAALALVLWRSPIQVVVPVTPGGIVQPVPAFVALDVEGTELVAVTDRGSAVSMTGLEVNPHGFTSCRSRSPDIPKRLSGNTDASFALGSAVGTGSIAALAECWPTAFGKVTVRLATGYADNRLSSENRQWTVNPDAGLCAQTREGVVTILTAAFIRSQVFKSDGDPSACAVSEDGRRLIVATRQGRLRQFGLDGEAVPITEDLPLPRGGLVTALATDDSGKAIVALQENGEAWVKSRNADIWRAVDAGQARRPLAMSGDGLTVAFANAASELEVWRLRPHNGRRLLRIDAQALAAESSLPASQHRITRLALTLLGRYGYTRWKGETAGLLPDDKLIIIADMGAAPRQDVNAIVSARRLGLFDANPREALLILLKPDGVADVPLGDMGNVAKAQRKSRWVMQVDTRRLDWLNEQLSVRPTAFDLETLVRDAAPASLGPKQSNWIGGWTSPDHGAGSFILRPRLPPGGTIDASLGVYTPALESAPVPNTSATAPDAAATAAAAVRKRPIDDDSGVVRFDTAVLFDGDSLHIADRYMLDALLDKLSAYDIRTVVLTGHAPLQADLPVNVKLASAMTEVVRDYLVSRGIPLSRIMRDYQTSKEIQASRITKDAEQSSKRSQVADDAEARVDVRVVASTRRALDETGTPATKGMDQAPIDAKGIQGAPATTQQRYLQKVETPQEPRLRGGEPQEQQQREPQQPQQRMPSQRSLQLKQ